ncbi:MAG: hypothetical protein QOI13_1602 [Paraburkholderia sp.]|nr:hypothetical protein [Paraburkholderia sp.]
MARLCFEATRSCFEIAAVAPAGMKAVSARRGLGTQASHCARCAPPVFLLCQNGGILLIAITQRVMSDTLHQRIF